MGEVGSTAATLIGFRANATGCCLGEAVVLPQYSVLDTHWLPSWSWLPWVPLKYSKAVRGRRARLPSHRVPEGLTPSSTDTPQTFVTER